jgi:SNF2 family DNA or RNA helicase
MNNVGELYSLIHFLRIKPYNEYQRFQSEFGMLTKGNSGKRDAANAMRKLQTVLKAILLRRTKQSQIDGKPIITLPPKSTEIQHVVFSDAELEFYQVRRFSCPYPYKFREISASRECLSTTGSLICTS